MTTHQVSGVFNVNMVAEPEAADQRRRDVRAKTRLFPDQLLQTSDRKRVLSTDVNCSYTHTSFITLFQVSSICSRPTVELMLQTVGGSMSPESACSTAHWPITAVYGDIKCGNWSWWSDGYVVRLLTCVESSMLRRVLHTQTELQSQLSLSCSALSRQLSDAPHRKSSPQQLVQHGTAHSESEVPLSSTEDGWEQRENTQVTTL